MLSKKVEKLITARRILSGRDYVQRRFVRGGLCAGDFVQGDLFGFVPWVNKISYRDNPKYGTDRPEQTV